MTTYEGRERRAHPVIVAAANTWAELAYSAFWVNTNASSLFLRSALPYGESLEVPR